MSYELIKEKLEKYKLHVGLIVAFVLVFFVGLGAGKYNTPKNPKAVESQLHYTTLAEPKTPAAEPVEPEVAGTQDPAATTREDNSTPLTKTQAAQQKTLTNKKPAGDTRQASNCPVKGNISSTGSKIYHVAGGAFYARVKPEQCFNDEAAAKAAGFRKSSR